jgi:hypothetical protein
MLITYVESLKTLINYNILILMSQSQDERRPALIIHRTIQIIETTSFTVDAIRCGSSVATSVEDQVTKLYIAASQTLNSRSENQVT